MKMRWHSHAAHRTGSFFRRKKAIIEIAITRDREANISGSVTLIFLRRR